MSGRFRQESHARLPDRFPPAPGDRDEGRALAVWDEWRQSWLMQRVEGRCSSN